MMFSSVGKLQGPGLLGNFRNLDHHTVDFLTPVERASVAAVTTGFPEIAQKAGVKHYEAVTGDHTRPLDANHSVHLLLERLKTKILSYPADQIPLEALEILKRTPTIQETLMLQKFIKARDTLVVWRVLACLISDPEEFTDVFETMEGVLQRAEGFSSWMEDHQSALIAIIRLDLSNNQLTEVPQEVWNQMSLKWVFLSNNFLNERNGIYRIPTACSVGG